VNEGLDLGFSEEQEAVRVAVDRFCTQRDTETIARRSGEPLPRSLWRDLAAVGVFYPGAPGHDAGGALEVCAIAETLGHHVFPGPVAATYIAIQALDEARAAEVIDGAALVSLSGADSTLLPFGTEADLFLVTDGERIFLADTPENIEPVATLGGELWGRALLKVDRQLTVSARGLVAGNIATAAYLAGAAWRLLRAAAEYAGTRRQFGRTLGEFQAVTHPLADCAIGLTGAQTLVRAAACSADSGATEDAECLAAGALVAARRAALKTAFDCHQVFGGIGVTLEGPAFHISRRIRQVASTPPLGARERELLLASAGLGG